MEERNSGDPDTEKIPNTEKIVSSAGADEGAM